jgi:nicotinic acid mononucleotide adenylyltransferase
MDPIHIPLATEFIMKTDFMMVTINRLEHCDCIARRALRRGESVRYLLQDLVIDYIAKHQLYSCSADITTVNNDK